MSADSPTASHLDTRMFSEFLAGLQTARDSLSTTPPDVVLNEREHPNIPELKISDGLVFHDIGGYAGKRTDGDFTDDFSLRWAGKLKDLPGDAPARFQNVVVLSDFVATGERDLAIVVPASLVPAAEKVFNLCDIRHSDTRGPWDSSTYSRLAFTIKEKEEGELLDAGDYVKFNFSPESLATFKSKLAVGAGSRSVTEKEEEHA